MMNAEQKQRATELVAGWRGIYWRDNGNLMAALLQELIDAEQSAGAPDDEPVAAQVRYMAVRVGLPSYGNSGFGPWQPAPMPKEGALLKGIDSVGYAYEIRLLYAAPQAQAVQADQSEHHLEMVNTPAPSVPDVANTFKRRAEEIVAMAVNRENYAKINRTIADLVTDIANAAEATTTAEAPADVARDAALYCAVQRACAELPEGWEIRIELERSAGTVILVNPDGEDVDYPSDHEYMASDINDAIESAIAAEKGGA